MKHVIITNPRCGSSYFTKGIAKHSQTLNLREVLNGMKYWGHVNLDEDNELKLDHTQKHIYRGVFRPHPNRKEGWVHEEIIPPDEVRRINNHFLKMMIKTRTPFTVKIHADHLYMADTNLINELLNNSKTYLLYREDVEDSVMSKFFIMNGVATPYESSKHLEQIIYALKTHEYLATVYNTRSFDHVIKYEDFNGVEQLKDFQPYFDEPLTPLEPSDLPRKLMTKEEKIQTMINYEDFKRDFDRESPDYGFIK